MIGSTMKAMCNLNRPSRFVLTLILSQVMILNAACDDDKEDENPSDNEQLDMSSPNIDRFGDYRVPTSAGGVSSSLKEFGEPCSSHLECLSNFCILNEDEGICTMSCLGNSCPEGWGCVASNGAGPDIEYLCSPVRSRQCKPCAGDGDCPAGRCIQLDGQAVCAKNCVDDRDCPGSYRCDFSEGVEGKQCLPESRSCTCTPSTEGTERLCEQSSANGTCYGRQVCDSRLGWSFCDAPLPSPEVCNLIDDDCNGLTDDVLMLGLTCENTAELISSDGDLETARCLGRMICTTESEEPVCTADTPSVERCNFIDDDCDGSTDEAFTGLGSLCVVGEGLCTRYGVYECAPTETELKCSVVEGPPSEEICDGLDNDCDGDLDEGFVSLGEACEVGIGLCRRVGVHRCSPEGDRVICSAEAASPVPELCDGLDNDCDGVIDNGFSGLNEICIRGVGFCQQAGFFSCSADQRTVSCTVDEEELSQRAQPELCDQIDNDCDQLVDEDFPTVNTPCQVGRGACERRGLMICSANRDQAICSVDAGSPEAERCDGIDNDCDGRVDELWPDLGQSCTRGQGICERSGVIRCTQDLLDGRCDAIEGAANAVETCDYADDDCDGSLDEGFVNELQVYHTTAHCGACGNDCTALWGDRSPEEVGVIPLCDTNQERPRCGFQCLPNRIDADGRTNNGCELEPNPDAIYVSPAGRGGTSSDRCGSITEPCFTLTHGMNRALAEGRRYVLASEGVYPEVVSLVEGIQVIGGHNQVSWEYDPSVFVSQIDTRNLPSPDGHSYGIIGIGIRSPTRISGFTVYTASALEGGNSYAVYLRDCDENLQITDNRLLPGDGGRGLDGPSGVSGEDGLEGTSGRNSASIQEPLSCGDPRQGFSGLAGGRSTPQICDDLTTTGGDGGNSLCPVFMEPNGSGFGGGGIGGGFGGLSGTHFVSNSPDTCAVTNNVNAYTRPDAQSGQAGQRGIDGQGGTVSGTSIGRGQLGHWLAFTGGNGEAGGAGGGGGGGGAASGIVVSWNGNANDFGASGGSGGNGGCPGQGGLGGRGGGGSFSIFITYLGLRPSVSAELPLLTNNALLRGYAGHGGRGGNGGGGGSGGSGGEGGQLGDVDVSVCSFRAGNGGSGGRGGHGGAGAGGNGGVSFDIALMGVPFNAPQSYASQNTFMLSEEIDTSGLGGIGGNSSSVSTGAGAEGRHGLSGHIGSL